MFSHFYTKTLSFVLIVSFVIPSALFLYPQKTEAAGAGCAAVVAAAIATVVGVSAASVLTGVPSADIGGHAGHAATTGASYGTFFKDCILTPLAIQLGKAMLRNITNSIVTWINNGFEGQPSFVQDFEGFMTDTTDQVLGRFIDNTLGLGFLCNNFSLQIRIALAQTYLPYEQRARCTLSDIQQNVNGFIQGDNSGGWDNFLSVTTEPQNNIYGATILAQNELSKIVAEKLKVQNTKLDWGKGFRSWESCDEYESPTDVSDRLNRNNPLGPQVNISGNSNSFDSFVVPGSTNENISFDGGKTSVSLPKQVPSFAKQGGSSDLSLKGQTGGNAAKPQCKEGKMTTKTPGTVIENQLALSLGSGVRQLEIAQDIEAIIGALTNQLMSQVITGAQGLLGASKKSSGGSSGGSTTYKDALNPTVDSGLSDAIDGGIKNLNKDTGFDDIYEESTLSTSPSTPITNPANTPVQNFTNTINLINISTPTTTEVVSNSIPLSHEIRVSSTQPFSGLLITTTLKKDGVAVPFLNTFNSVQVFYGQSNSSQSIKNITSPTDASAAWSNVSVAPGSDFVLNFQGNKISGGHVFTQLGTYLLETTLTDSNGTVLKTQVSNFTVQ
jgi:hypothetical protein